ncbi:hypothetical protein QEH52_02290 [Coraliomargarita sp. SDUM461003]|uniref:PEP-CTERM protein-sorting domain-containing protein n=1 Tax=Thalassobacterium maritimum TaxID=3041265 RepID=A0ABU1AQ97_9BACT|nr:hypothetical protein [Coraliomargarita sp. SDUM461003]MDQ8206320.1 hypothetical protein [Coraliomargarita sp. SDUM461003]
MKSKLTFLPALAFAALSITPGTAAVIISDSFDGSSAVALNGQNATTFSSDITTAGGSATWVAGSVFRADGTLPGSGDVDASAALSVGSYINDAKGTANGVFTLTSTISQVAGASGANSWIGMTFFTGTYFKDDPLFKNNFAVGVAIRRAAEGTTFFDYIQSPGSVGTSYVTTDWGAVGAADATFTTVLDLSGWNGTDSFGSIEFYLNGSSTPDAVANLTSDYDFSLVGLSYNQNASGTVESFSLAQIPEPSFLPLVLLSSLAVLIRRRR